MFDVNEMENLQTILDISCTFSTTELTSFFFYCSIVEVLCVVQTDVFMLDLSLSVVKQMYLTKYSEGLQIVYNFKDNFHSVNNSLT